MASVNIHILVWNLYWCSSTDDPGVPESSRAVVNGPVCVHMERDRARRRCDRGRHSKGPLIKDGGRASRRAVHLFMSSIPS